MGNRFINERIRKAHASHIGVWAGLHQGKYWKRQMNKARRRAWKQYRIQGKPDNKYERFCELKGW